MFLGNITGVIFFIGSIAFLTLYAYSTRKKSRTRHRASIIIERDCAAYDHVWSTEIVAAPENRALLEELRTIVSDLEIGWQHDIEGGALAVMQTRDRLRQVSSAANTTKPRQCLSDLRSFLGKQNLSILTSRGMSSLGPKVFEVLVPRTFKLNAVLGLFKSYFEVTPEMRAVSSTWFDLRLPLTRSGGLSRP